ncbi:hypothetical protein SAMN04488084_106125 [Pedobacter antarcticus]|nr:hypothetical protein SAMN04488084_106125 [Pedobacter antarcticus]
MECFQYFKIISIDLVVYFYIFDLVIKNTDYTYKERLREWPCNVLATSAPAAGMKGANSSSERRNISNVVYPV